MGLADDTLIIVTSDNGCHEEPIGLKEKYDHLGNYIYRGQKSDAWDGGASHSVYRFVAGGD